jgi:hypothetical protein
MKGQDKYTSSDVQGNPVYLESFIWKSEVSDGHCTYLGIGRDDGTADQWRIHTFGSIVKAWDCLNKVKKLLPNFQFDSNKTNDEIALSFYDLLAKKYPELEMDNNDGSYQVSGDSKIIQNWEKAGNRWGVDAPPPGVSVVCRGPLYFAKYKVLEIESPVRKEVVKGMNSKCGNPNGYFWYTIGEEVGKPFGNYTLVFDGYITAAYLADYINKEKKETLTEKEVKDLMYEANRMQGNLLDSVSVLPLERLIKEPWRLW